MEQIYLSRLRLDPACRQARLDVGDCQALHRTVMSAFPDTPEGPLPPRSAFGVLHRLDLRPEIGDSELLVQSRVTPDWSRLPPGYLRAAPDYKDVTAFYLAITSGRSLRFRLLANATKKVDSASRQERLSGVRKNGARVPLLREDLPGWLERKAEHAGFRVLRANVQGGGEVPYVPAVHAARGTNVRGRRAGSLLTFAPALFDGLIEVVEGGAFRAALADGIGPAKAYGFGLLSIAPPE